MATAVIRPAKGLFPRWGSYVEQSRRPLVSLTFVVPLLILYEVGVLLLPHAMRNGADLWLRRLLDTLGLGGYFLLPVMTVFVLLAWHHTTRQAWKVPTLVLWGMLCETALLGLVLVAVAKLTGRLFTSIGHGTTAALAPVWDADWQGIFAQVISFSGAGLYEEVLFRLLLLPLAVWLIRAAGAARPLQVLGGILATSALFSLAHYVGQYGDPLSWYTFVFRFVAGAFCAILFVYRGFGIAAGSHALYDVFVGVRWF